MELSLSPLGLGCAQLGNLYHAISDETAAATVRRAWDEGVRYFDTAPHYGLGLSETRLGAALRSFPRDEYVLSTKVGRVLEPNPDGAGAQSTTRASPSRPRTSDAGTSAATASCGPSRTA